MRALWWLMLALGCSAPDLGVTYCGGLNVCDNASEVCVIDVRGAYVCADRCETDDECRADEFCTGIRGSELRSCQVP